MRRGQRVHRGVALLDRAVAGVARNRRDADAAGQRVFGLAHARGGGAVDLDAEAGAAQEADVVGGRFHLDGACGAVDDGVLEALADALQVRGVAVARADEHQRVLIGRSGPGGTGQQQREQQNVRTHEAPPRGRRVAACPGRGRCDANRTAQPRTTSSRGSVMSSIALRTPSRPRPDCFTPP